MRHGKHWILASFRHELGLERCVNRSQVAPRYTGLVCFVLWVYLDAHNHLNLPKEYLVQHV